MVGNVFSIAFNTYNEVVIKQLALVDGSIVRFAESDTLFLSVNGNKKTPLNPANALVRFQLMEVLMRIAFKRYYESI